MDGKRSAYQFDAATSTLSFTSGALGGQRAKYDASHSPQTITFLTANGELGDSCDHQS